MFRKFAVLLTPLALALSITACGGDDESAGGGKSAGGKSGGGTIAVITVDPSNPYWKA